jgi:hypothetical protein
MPEKISLVQNFAACVVHGSTASTTRPPVQGVVLWIGTVVPTNMVTNDVAINPNGNNSLILSEQADIAAPAANGAVVYARDNGSGKTQLVVRFNTGAIQVIATEP